MSPMDFLLPLITLWAAQLLAAISPGQSFVLISKLALSNPRPVALAAVMGLGLGTIIWSTAAILGVAIVLKQAAWAYILLKVAGGVYLIFLALMLWRHAKDPVELDTAKHNRMKPRPAFMLGLVTQLANPKVIVFFGSIFVALLPVHSPLWVYVAVVLIVFCNEIGWYAGVAMLFSAQKSRNVYIRAKTWIDRVMGGFLGLIGARLIVDA